MPQVQIELPDDVYKKLKTKAKENYQSLRGYVTSSLVKLTRGEVIDTSLIPENTIIKTTTAHTLTPEEIEEQIEKLILNKKEQIKLGKNIKQKVLNEFSWDNTTKKIVNTIKFK